MLVMGHAEPTILCSFLCSCVFAMPYQAMMGSVWTLSAVHLSKFVGLFGDVPNLFKCPLK